MTEQEEKYYLQGFRDGLTCFAHWKDGEEFVGTQETKLKGAKAVAKTQWNYNPRPAEELK